MCLPVGSANVWSLGVDVLVQEVEERCIIKGLGGVNMFEKGAQKKCYPLLGGEEHTQKPHPTARLATL